MLLLGVCGSSRSNRRSWELLEMALESAESSGARVVTLDLAATPLPPFAADRPATDDPPIVAQVRERCAAADAFILVSPEYHGSMSGLMKNFLDYHCEEFAGKLFGLIAATGGSHGIGCIAHMRAAVQHCHGWTLPYQAAAKSEEFADDAPPFDRGKTADRVRRIGRDTVMYGKLLRDRYERDAAAADTRPDAYGGYAPWAKG